MINLGKIYKNFGLLEVLVSFSIIYVISMLIWTASTREAVESKANEIKYNHKQVVTFMNDQVNNCDQNKEGFTKWGEACNSTWKSKKIVDYLLMNIDFKNPYSTKRKLVEASEDPRIQAEGKAGQSTDKGIIFVSSQDFINEAGSEWIIGTCVKSPCVAAGNNELVSIYR
jgi:hypothetical protein